MNSEEFFRKCWLTLKATNPRFVKRMTEIECGMEGIRIQRTEIPAEDKRKENERDKIVPI